MAGLSQDEWSINFGFPGLMLMPIVLGCSWPGWTAPMPRGEHVRSAHDIWWRLAIVAAIVLWGMWKVSRVRIGSSRREVAGSDQPEDDGVVPLPGPT